MLDTDDQEVLILALGVLAQNRLQNKPKVF